MTVEICDRVSVYKKKLRRKVEVKVVSFSLRDDIDSDEVGLKEFY